MTEKTLSIHSRKKIEMIPVTDQIQRILDTEAKHNGWIHLFVPHTTAGITLNEQADPDVAADLEFFMARLSPDLAQYRHIEGNTSAHALSTLVGVSLLLPVRDRSLRLGRWQGVFFCEFDGPRTRTIILNFTSDISE